MKFYSVEFSYDWIHRIDMSTINLSVKSLVLGLRLMSSSTLVSIGRLVSIGMLISIGLLVSIGPLISIGMLALVSIGTLVSFCTITIHISPEIHIAKLSSFLLKITNLFCNAALFTKLRPCWMM